MSTTSMAIFSNPLFATYSVLHATLQLANEAREKFLTPPAFNLEYMKLNTGSDTEKE